MRKSHRGGKRHGTRRGGDYGSPWAYGGGGGGAGSRRYGGKRNCRRTRRGGDVTFPPATSDRRWNA